MTEIEIAGATEAILFASGEPVSKSRIITALNISKQDFKKALIILENKYHNNDSGIMLLKLEDDLQLCSNSKYITFIREVMNLKKNTPLSPAAMEVLSLVAYNQPVTKAFIEQVRGVDCSGVIASLSLRELIEEAGRLELPGRPLLYRVTDNFLRCFGLSSLSELPPIPNEENGEVKEENEQLTFKDEIEKSE